MTDNVSEAPPPPMPEQPDAAMATAATSAKPRPSERVTDNFPLQSSRCKRAAASTRRVRRLNRAPTRPSPPPWAARGLDEAEVADGIDGLSRTSISQPRPTASQECDGLVNR